MGAPVLASNRSLLFSENNVAPFGQVTGDASSFARRALVASVSHAGQLVEPVSLSAAIDISPPVVADLAGVDEKDGPGPLASAALIEQAKEAGATQEVR